MVLRIEPVLSAPTTAAAAVSIDLRRRVFPTSINPYNLKIHCATTETLVSHSSTLIEPASSLERAAMKTFQDLPSELVKDISTYLDGLSLSASRLTSTWTSKIGLEVLAQRIRKSRFLVAPHSMGALLDISDHEHVAPKIDVLRLSTWGLTSGLYEFSNHLQEIHPGTDFYTPEESSVVRDWRKFEQHISTHIEFWQGDDVGMLTGALCSLSNLRSIEVGDWISVVDSVPDPFGMATLRQIIKTKYPNDFKDAFDIAHWTCCDLNHVFFAVLRALASSRRKIESLSVTPGFGLESQYNTPDVLLIVPFFDSSDDPEPMPVLDGYLGVRLRPALDNLRSLRLVVSWVPSTDGDDPYYEMNWLPQFVNLAPQLEHLAIRQSDFTTAGLSAFWDQVHMPRLKTVEFVHGVAVSETMQKFLKRHSTTLTEMSLEYFSSSPGSWTDILPTLLEVSVASEITLKGRMAN